MPSSLCSTVLFGLLTPTFSPSLANFGSSNLPTACSGLQFRTLVGVNDELQGRVAGELAWFYSFQVLVSNY